MKQINIERNKLDYLLSDLLPLEITELFSLNDFYKYLCQNTKTLEQVVMKIKSNKELNDKILFNNGWATAPLKFNILKGNSGQREMSLIQPTSMINIYLFLELYQKELLILLNENSVFSLRYHKKNNDLYYKKRVKKISEYYESIARKIDKGVLQQTGTFFKIAPYNSVSSFTNSRAWQRLNFKYNNFARMDYKSCFDSIYTHVYKWIYQKNVVDSKAAINGSLFVTIDKLLQNINAKSSNGIVVGPEFSRMIVELLLQHIDVTVKTELSIIGLEKDIDYNVFRYVDDIFIFANSEDSIDKIIEVISLTSQSYLIRPNDLKLFKSKTPFTMSAWLLRTRELADKISTLFYSDTELKSLEGEDKRLIKNGYLHIDKIKGEFNTIICDFPNEKRMIISFCLSTLINNISKKKRGIKLIKTNESSKAFHILDLALFFYAHCTCFEHTQKIISMFVYFDDELNFKTDDYNQEKLQGIFNQYMFVFSKGNLNDLCNLLLFFQEYKIVIPTKMEDKIFSDIMKENNPLLLATYLLYSRYNRVYHKRILSETEIIIDKNIEQITEKDEMLQTEFWYVLIFINCPFINTNSKNKMIAIVDKIKKLDAKTPSDIINNLLCVYLKSGHNNLFFTWGSHRFSTSKQIAFRTDQRSLFRQYKKKYASSIYGSID